MRSILVPGLARRAALLVLSLAALACRGEQRATAGGPDGGTIVMAVPGDPDFIAPPFVQSQVGREIVDQVFDRVAEIGQDLNTTGDAGFQPRLAKSWDWARDSMSIAFHLDPKARWHDGRPVRANDVKFSFDVIKDPATGSPTASVIRNVDSVTTTDSLTAVVWFHQRSPQQFYDFAYQIWIFPEHVYGKVPHAALRTSEILRTPIGSGRFRVARWESGSRIELLSDTGNYRGRAKLDRVIYTIVPDANAAIAQLRGGALDFYEYLTPPLVAELRGDATMAVLPYPSLQFAWLGMNLQSPKAKTPHPIFGDVRVRRALSMAVDRAAMLHNVFDSLGRLSHGPFPTTFPDADTTLALIPYDTVGARALLDSAGWRAGADGIRVKGGQRLAFGILVPNSSKARMAYAVLLQQAMGKVGADVKLDQVDAPTYYQRRGTGAFDTILDAYSPDPNPGGMQQIWGSRSAPPEGTNVLHYANPTVDAAFDSAQRSYDVTKRKAYMRRGFQQIIADAPGVWLYDVPTIAAKQKRIRTAPMRADEWWANLADWSIPADQRIARDRIGLGPAGGSTSAQQ